MANQIKSKKDRKKTTQPLESRSFGERKYSISLLWMVVYVALTAFVTQGLTLFGSTGVATMPHAEFFALSGVSVLLGVGMILFARLKFGVRLHWVFVAFGILLIAIDALGTSLFPDHIEPLPWMGAAAGDSVYEITTVWRLRSLVGWLVSVVGL